MVLVEDHQVPVGGMYPLIPRLDAAGVLVDAQVVLERTEADNGPGFIGGFVGQVRVPGDKLPALEINMGL